MPNYKTFILIVTCINITPLLMSQNKLSAGFEGGPALIFFWGGSIITAPSNGYDPYPDIGYMQRAAVTYHFHKNLGIKSGIQYEKIGGQFVSNNTAYRDRVEALTLPLALTCNVGKQLKFTASAGIFFSYLMRYTTRMDNNGVADPIFDNSFVLKGFNTGVLLSAGAEYTFKNNVTVGGELYNQLGLYNIHKQSNIGTGVTDLRTNSLQLLIRVSYTFNLHKKDSFKNS